MKDFRGRVAVVTGGASGIGFALAKAFIGEGMKVVIADVEESALKSATEELGGDVTGIVTDAIDEARFSAPQELHTHQVHAGGFVYNTPVVANVSLAIKHRHLEPRIVRAKPGCPYDRLDTAAIEVDEKRR